MIKLTEDKGKPIIDLDGQEGNAFVLLCIARSAFQQLGYTPQAIEHHMTEMKSSDYYHLVKTFDSLLGDFYELRTQNENLFAQITSSDLL